MFSLLVGVVVSRVRLCFRRSLVLMPLGAVGVVAPRGTVVEEHGGAGRSRSRSRSRSAFALALLVGAKLLSEVASLPLVVTYG